ncbi:MAG TPA: FG-GAP-like repeat-containing protein [Steroidobacteraceae bacterium]|nr:FG-GAP-like repeat-containing protein [Steroidobacteraceae bacterium]
MAKTTAPWAVRGTFALISALALAGCSDAFGTSPPHAAPANPVAEAGDGEVELRWSAVTGATKYSILWRDETLPAGEFTNQIKDIQETTYTHTGLVNLRLYEYRIVAETSGGRGPESLTVRAVPGPVPGAVEWTVVTSENPGHSIHFAPAANATHYRVYFSAAESQLLGRRPFALFDQADESPHVRPEVALATPLYYRVIAMNDERIGVDGPIAVSATHEVVTLELPRVNTAWGDPNGDGCADTVTSDGTVTGTTCLGGQVARVLPDAGLADLLAAGRTTGDSRFADVTGDGSEDLFSNTLSPAGTAGSVALLHVNQSNGNYQTSAGVTALAIGGFGGTLLAADFDNDGDVDLFAPNDHTRGDGARNWLLINNGGGVFTDTAAAAGLASNPAGATYVPRGGQAVDFNEDGFIDLLFGSRLMLNNGDGTFSNGSAAANMPVRADEGLKLFDVDLDGDLDLLHFDGAVTRLYRNTAGVFDGGTIVNQDAVSTFGRGLNACDINSDGFEDVLIASNLTATGTGVPRLLVNVAGTLMPSAVPREIVADTDDLVAPNDLLACGDVDGNGVIDVLARWGTNYRLMRAARPLTSRIRLRVVGVGGEQNQQGRIVRITPQDTPDRIMTRVIESGSGLHSQNQYDLLVGAPWPGEYEITVGFAAGDVTTTAEAGDELTIFADGRVEAGLL